MIISKNCKVRLSLTDKGKVYMNKSLNERANNVYKFSAAASVDLSDDISFIEYLKNEMNKDIFELTYIEFVDIFGTVTAESALIKDGKLELLEGSNG